MGAVATGAAAAAAFGLAFAFAAAFGLAGAASPSAALAVFLAAAFFAGALAGLVPVFYARSLRRTIASSSVTLDGSFAFGSVALTLPALT